MKQNTKQQKQGGAAPATRAVSYRPFHEFAPPGECPRSTEGDVYDIVDRVRRHRGVEQEQSQFVMVMPAGESEQKQWLSSEVAQHASDLPSVINDLVYAIKAGVPKAAAVLLKLAREATVALNSADAMRLRPLARRKESWPVLAARKGQLDSETMDWLEKIQLGADTFGAQLRKPQGAGWTPRAWARLILDTLNANRNCAALVADPSFERDLRVILEKELASGQATIAPVPQWARDCAHLDVFNANTLPDSWKTGKAMLRQQCPDFHEHKDWKHYAARWAGLQKGVIQNRILDLIKSALENLANASANPATEI